MQPKVFGYLSIYTVYRMAVRVVVVWYVPSMAKYSQHALVVTNALACIQTPHLIAKILLYC